MVSELRQAPKLQQHCSKHICWAFRQSCYRYSSFNGGHPWSVHYEISYAASAGSHIVEISLQATWPDGHPEKGHIMEAARQARYELLESKCMELDIPYLMTAHHAGEDHSRLSVYWVCEVGAGPSCIPMQTRTTQSFLRW